MKKSDLKKCDLKISDLKICDLIKKSSFISAVMLIVFLSALSVAAAQPGLVINGSKSDFEPIIKNSRLLVPARPVFEEIGGNVAWNGADKTVTIVLDGKTVKLTLGSKVINVSGKDGDAVMQSDTPPEIINETTYVPLTVITEATGVSVEWNADEKTAYVSYTASDNARAAEKPFDIIINGKTIKMGDSTEKTAELLGKYDSQHQSVYSYFWQSFGSGSDYYALIGADNNACTAFYSNSKNVTIAGITPGMSATELNKALGAEFPNKETTVIENQYGLLTIYRSSFDDFSVLAVHAQKAGYQSVKFDYSNNFYQEALENQLVDTLNADRANRGLKPFAKDAQLSAVARAHSASMAVRGVLSHDDEKGDGPFERMEKGGITDYVMASENIGRGYINGIEAYASWMNNKIYYTNIVSENYNTVGIGAAVSGMANKLYFTADFIER